ncbi:MAG: NAD(P)H-dependent oxidoreductase [Lachnospiraceae bacterium]|nr:NAD(P)H-dependent oxidoreductase [Lachnospiraceae bacterium]
MLDAVHSASDGIALQTAKTPQDALRYLSARRIPERSDSPLRVLFAVCLPEDGVCFALSEMLRILRASRTLMRGCVGALIVDGAGELYTKSTAAQLVLAANGCGCAFIGRPLVEATGSLLNFAVTARNLGTDLMDACLQSVSALVRELLAFRGFSVIANRAADNAADTVSRVPRLLALHASSHETSNTFALWRATKERLTGMETREIGLRNGVLVDCSGCPFNMCLHFGENDSCFYGGVMTDDVYPALREANAVLMICPNYNDAISANLTAFINRLTAMYRKRPFSDKALFAIVVSGYSGSDIVLSQLIAALNMNKSFFLPPHFALYATANDPGSVMKIKDIGSQIASFASGIQRTLTA